MFMQRKWWLIALLLTGLIVVLAIRHFRSSDQAAIRRQINSLTTNVSRPEGEGAIRLAFKNQRLAPLFADPCRFIFPSQNLALELRPQEVAAEVARVHARVASFSLRLHDVSIALAGDSRAEITATASVRGSGQNWGERPHQDSLQVNIEMVKVDGEWRFAKFEEVQVLQR